jgi:hypothetical protein
MLESLPAAEDRYLVYLGCLVCLVTQDELDELIRPDEPDKPGLSRRAVPLKFCCAEMIFPQPATPPLRI